MVHSPVTGQRVSRRRRGDEIAQQVSARVGKETHFSNFHVFTFTIKHLKTFAKIWHLFSWERSLMRCIAAAFL